MRALVKEELPEEWTLFKYINQRFMRQFIRKRSLLVTAAKFGVKNNIDIDSGSRPSRTGVNLFSY